MEETEIMNQDENNREINDKEIPDQVEDLFNTSTFSILSKDSSVIVRRGSQGTMINPPYINLVF